MVVVGRGEGKAGPGKILFGVGKKNQEFGYLFNNCLRPVARFWTLLADPARLDGDTKAKHSLSLSL